MRRRAVAAVLPIAGLGVVAGFAALAGPAAGESGRLADFAVGLSSQAPGSSTGMRFHAQFHRADDPDAKPSPIRSAVVELPPGLRIDTAALPQCTASDEELRAAGSEACPEETELTVGTLVGITGFGPPADPLVGDDHVFNGPNQLIEVISAPGSSASPAFDRLTIEGTTMKAHPPVTPGGPPDGETAVRSIDFEVPVRTDGGKPFITTPPSCPASGVWTTTGTFLFADGSSDTVSTVTPCVREAVAPRLRLVVRPRHVRAGRATRLRLRVTSSEASCVAGARVAFGGRSVKVGRDGRASMRITPRRLGLRRVVATKPGCREWAAHVRVVRA
jgi:hypothetical protein